MAHTAGAGLSPPRRGDSAGQTHESVVWTGSRSWASILFSFVQSLPEELATALERRRRTLLLLFSLAYLASIGIVASRRPLWADEVLTAYITRLGWRQLWPALASGVDLEPPLFHLISRAFTSVLGPTPLALRMPAIVGGWLMSISLFHFVSRRRPVAPCWIAAKPEARTRHGLHLYTILIDPVKCA